MSVGHDVGHEVLMFFCVALKGRKYIQINLKAVHLHLYLVGKAGKAPQQVIHHSVSFEHRGLRTTLCIFIRGWLYCESGVLGTRQTTVYPRIHFTIYLEVYLGRDGIFDCISAYPASLEVQLENGRVFCSLAQNAISFG